MVFLIMFSSIRSVNQGYLAAYAPLAASQRQAANLQAADSAAVSRNSASTSVSISSAARQLAAQDEARATATSGNTYQVETSVGTSSIDFDAYFSPGFGANQQFAPGEFPILLPNEANVAALNAHVAKAFPAFLAANNIPEAPSSMSVDSAGNLQLPADYPYADQLKKALAGDQRMDQQLRSLNSLSSYVADGYAMAPFEKEMANAAPGDVEGIVNKYRWLFTPGRSMPETSIHFSKSGQPEPWANGRPLAENKIST